MKSPLPPSRISLLLILAFFAFIELLTNRIGIHIASAPARAGSTLFKIVDTFGLFSFYVTGLLALAVLAWAVVILTADAKIFRLGSRIAITFAAAAFLPLAGVGLFIRIPAPLSPWLNVSFAILTLTLVIGFLLRPAGVRAKLGVVYLAAPLLLHAYWLFTQQLPALAPAGVNADLPARLVDIGEHLVIVSAFAAFLFFAPMPRISTLLSPFPVAVSLLLTVVVSGLITLQSGLAAKAARFGLGLSLPAATSGELLYLTLHLSAFFFFVLLLTTLALRGSKERGLSLGLLLLAVSGYHLELFYQLLLITVALIQIMRSLQALHLGEQSATSPPATPPAGVPTPGQWKTYLHHLAKRSDVKDAEAVALTSEGTLVARLHGRIAGLPVLLRLQLRHGLLDEIEIDVGIVPKDNAPASLWRKSDRRGRRVPDSRAERLKSFDPAFVARDDTGQIIEGLTPSVDDLRRWIHGSLAIWPGEGLRYIARPLTEGWPIPIAAVTRDPETAPASEAGALIALLLEIAQDINVR